MPQTGLRPGMQALAIAVAALAAGMIAGRPVASAAPPKAASTAPAAEARPAQDSGRTSPTKGSAAAADVYWVQVGAFRDAQTAGRVAQRLRDQKYSVQETRTSRQVTEPRARATGGSSAEGRDRYEVVVTGGPGSDVAAALAAKGLTSRAATEGATVTPSLSLAEAVALSKDLTGDGLAVRVRRAETAGSVSPAAGGGADGEGLHRVRVGGYADRAAAEAALKDLESRGFKPILVRGTD